jgi:hypothetical protein
MLPSHMTMPDTRLEFHLSNWARWMELGGIALGFPPKSAGFVGGGYNHEFDTMVADADTRAAETVDALIDGLPILENIAICHRYLAAVWRGRDLESALDRAKDKLRTGLQHRGMY